MTSAAQFRALPEREVGLAHLSLLQLEPAELVRVAAAAGFGFVGVRVRGATPGERIADLAPGSAAARATLAALEETGIRIRDIEFLSLDGATGREDWLPMLEAGAALGATTLSLAGNDTDEARMTAALAELAADAADHGIVPTLEPISYNEVSTVAQAVRIARAAGAAILLDPLHLHRGGEDPAAVSVALADAAAEETARLVPVLQLCDALLAGPGAELADAPMPPRHDGGRRPAQARVPRPPARAGRGGAAARGAPRGARPRAPAQRRGALRRPGRPARARRLCGAPARAHARGRRARADVRAVRRAHPCDVPRRRPVGGGAMSPGILLGLLGEHIGGSLTPLMHEAEARRQGVPLLYRILDGSEMTGPTAHAGPADASGAATPDWGGLLGQARDLTFDGLNVTHPAKQAVIPALDELDADAELLGAVNTVVLRGGRAIGMNTDHLGFSGAIDALRDGGAEPGLGSVVQLGAGGAGAATAYSLLLAGVDRLLLADVDPARVEALIDRLARGFDRSRMVAIAPDEAPEAVRAADGLVNSTPIGMRGVSEDSPIDTGALHPGLWVGDVVYRPLRSALVRAAESIGCPAFGGAEMAVGQAAAAFRIFTGREADRAAMRADFIAAAGPDPGPDPDPAPVPGPGSASASASGPAPGSAAAEEPAPAGS